MGQQVIGVALMALVACIYVLFMANMIHRIITLIKRAPEKAPLGDGDIASRAQTLIDAGASPAVADILARNLKINAIKVYREETGAGLAESKAAVDRLARALHRNHPLATPAPPQA